MTENYLEKIMILQKSGYKCLLWVLIFWITSYSPPVLFAHAQQSTPQPLEKVEVIVTMARIREGPGTNYHSIDSKSMGDQLDVYAQSEDGQWLLVSLDPPGWIAHIQVKAMTEGQQLPTFSPTETLEPSSSLEIEKLTVISLETTSTVEPLATTEQITQQPTTFTEIYAKIKQYIGKLLSPIIGNEIVTELIRLFNQTWQEDPNSVIGTSFPLMGIGIYFLVSVLLIILSIFSFQWRWIWGEIILILFLGPIGIMFCFVVTLFIFFNRSYLRQSSPKKMYGGIINSGPVIGLVVILFIIFSAVSILGGILFLGPIVLYFKFVELILPDMPHNSQVYAPSIFSSQSTSSPYSTGYTEDYESSSLLSYGEDYSSWNDDYNDYSRQDEDDDDNDDDKPSSIWDGWLVKW